MSADEEFEPYDDPSLKGISRYFNNRTIKGRANVALATYVSIGCYFIYKKLLAPKKLAEACPPKTEK